MIIIFCREPREGHVKTRLAAGIGNQPALQAYRIMAEHTMDAVRRSNLDAMVACDTEGGMAAVSEWLSATTIAQRGADLGARMIHAVMVGLEDDDRTIIIGTDAPMITADIIMQADALLDEHDVVIGPCTDGGYYLIGMSGPHLDVFRGIAWSTPEVFNATLENCARLRLSVALLPSLDDVDTAEDLQRITEVAPGTDVVVDRLRRILSPKTT